MSKTTQLKKTGIRKPKTRRCPRCQTVKPLTKRFWHKDNSTHGKLYRAGYQGHCRVCRTRRPKPVGKKKKNTVPTQECSKCKKSLAINTENFHRDPKSNTGFRKICKPCRKS